MYCRRSDRFSRRTFAPRRSQTGAALVIALLAFALCAALLVSMQAEFTRFFARTGNVLVSEQAYAYLLGGEQLASIALVADYDLDKQRGERRDDLNELWAREEPPFPLDDDGWLSGKLEDLQGRFNLNHLATPAQKSSSGLLRQFTASQEQFIRLLQALDGVEVSQQDAILIADAVSDWIDADQTPLDNGAEDDYYYGRDPAYRAGNRPMASTSELLSVAHMTPEIYTALAPYVTVWPAVPESLNIHTAGIPLLRSIGPDKELSPLSLADGEALVEVRSNGGFADVDDLLKQPMFQGANNSYQKVTSLLAGDSSYFLLVTTVELADRNRRLYSVLHRDNRLVQTLVRASGSL